MRISLGWKKIELKWGDGTLSVEVRPMTRGAQADVAAIYEGREEGQMMTVQEITTMQEVASTVFPAHARNLQGLEDSEGEVITLEQVTEEGKLSALCLEIVTSLVLASTLTKEEMGNSPGPATTT